MADPQPRQQQVQIRIDESKMQTHYANTMRTHSTADEVVLDFGLNMPQQNQEGQTFLNFGVSARVVTPWAGAKRLAMSLNQLISQYEQRFGEIQLQRPQPPAQDA